MTARHVIRKLANYARNNDRMFSSLFQSCSRTIPVKNANSYTIVFLYKFTPIHGNPVIYALNHFSSSTKVSIYGLRQYIKKGYDHIINIDDFSVSCKAISSTISWCGIDVVSDYAKPISSYIMLDGRIVDAYRLVHHDYRTLLVNYPWKWCQSEILDYENMMLTATV